MKPTIAERMAEVDRIIKKNHGLLMIQDIIFLRNAYEAMRNVAISRYYGTTYDVAVKSIDELAEAELAKIGEEMTIQKKLAEIDGVILKLKKTYPEGSVHYPMPLTAKLLIDCRDLVEAYRNVMRNVCPMNEDHLEQVEAELARLEGKK